MVMINEIFDKKAIEDLKVGDQLPFDVIEDLNVFMKNDPMFYRQQTYPAMCAVQKAVQNGGKYNKKELFPMIDKAIESYCAEFKIPKRPADLLNDSEKMECVTRLLRGEIENFRNGDY
jgi:hypothetical protein